MRTKVNKEMRYILKKFYFKVALLWLGLSGCQLVHDPSYTLGQAFDKQELGKFMTRDEVLSTYGQLVVPCENPQNVCYLYAEIHRMKLNNSQIVEFVIDEHSNVEQIVYRSR